MAERKTPKKATDAPKAEKPKAKKATSAAALKRAADDFAKRRAESRRKLAESQTPKQ